MVNINTVYQTVLALANKEQRGYITPQEFNLFANQAQMSIFEQYFYDINQFNRVPGNDTAYADMTSLLEEKISIFEKSTAISAGTIPADLYKIQNVIYNTKPVEQVTAKEYLEMQNVALCKPSNLKPVYYKQGNQIFVHGDSQILSPWINYVRKPQNPNWTYFVVDEKAVYNESAADHRNFEVHASEQTDLVIKILQLAGITLKDPSLYQVASSEDNKNIQQQKA
jgi:hypothetical protein